MMTIDDNTRRAIDNARALLDALLANGWREVVVKGHDGDYFLTRESGVANPLLAEAPPHSAQADLAGSPVTMITIHAPHVATVAWLVAPGSTLASGAVVARLAVLDEEIDVLAEAGGTVAGCHAKVGDLVEYRSELLDICA